ncbi:hypothetical protein [Jatrophihabitans fulvus]
MHRYRFALRPGWVALHVLTVAMVVTMASLGRWQLDVSDQKHFNVRNFGYALQWWAFALFTLLMWFRVMRDRVRNHDASGAPVDPPAPVESERDVAYRRYVPPPAPAPEDDTMAAYNDYLAQLNARHEKETGSA